MLCTGRGTGVPGERTAVLCVRCAGGNLPVCNEGVGADRRVELPGRPTAGLTGRTFEGVRTGDAGERGTPTERNAEGFDAIGRVGKLPTGRCVNPSLVLGTEDTTERDTVTG